MEKLINKYANEITEKLEGNLDTLILVGSFARGEGIEGVSDIEFWAVVKDLGSAKKPDLGRDVSLGFTTRRHLKRLKPYIYTVEVRKFGKVLYGDKNILELIPDYSYDSIFRVDGFILLNNRIVEQLILLSRIEGDQSVSQYEFNKGYVQLINVLLVLHKKYKSLYPEKIREFCKIHKDNNTGFLNKVEEAFASIGKQIASGATHSRNDGIGKKEALSRWQELRVYFKKVWAEELGILDKVRYWLNLLSLGKISQFLIYRKAAGLYFSDKYSDKKQRETIIRQWKTRIK
ncbi:MAG: hypothetical protein WC532_02740 [Candidatus Omnitrophota bacterium]